jgi:hypothetical protein
MTQLLDNPTPENAQRYLDWEEKRMARISAVQLLLSTLSHKKGPP